MRFSSPKSGQFEIQIRHRSGPSRAGGHFQVTCSRVVWRGYVLCGFSACHPRVSGPVRLVHLFVLVCFRDLLFRNVSNHPPPVLQRIMNAFQLGNLGVPLQPYDSSLLYSMRLTQCILFFGGACCRGYKSIFVSLLKRINFFLRSLIPARLRRKKVSSQISALCASKRKF